MLAVASWWLTKSKNVKSCSSYLSLVCFSETWYGHKGKNIFYKSIKII